MTDVHTLDVRPLVPIRRHETLLDRFAQLPAGESFVFINDHDPKPLYYEIRSIFGDVVDWEYLARSPKEWTVKVTRTEASKGRDMGQVSTLIDLRKADPADWKHIIFHRYSMMQVGDVMEIRAAEAPGEIHAIFGAKFAGRHTWTVQGQDPDEYVVHVEKCAADAADELGAALVAEFDIRPYHPARRHEMVFEAFDKLGPGEAFVFTNDHDPRPLYYQMEAESEEAFEWKYLQSGPEEWTVRVAKTG